MLLLRVRFKGVATDDIYHLVFHATDVMQEVFQQGPLCGDSLESLLRCSVCSYLNLGLGHTIPDPSDPVALLVEVDHCPCRCLFINRPHAQSWDIRTGHCFFFLFVFR